MNTPVIPEMFRSAAAQVREQGWVIEATGSHLRWVSPAGAVVMSAATPSDRKALPRHVAELRRAGAVIDGRTAASKPEADAEEVTEPAPAVEPEAVSGDPRPEVAELRELVSEARALLRDLRQEKKDTSEWLAANIREVVTAEANRLCDAALADMDKRYTAELARVIKMLEDAAGRDDQIFQSRMADANSLIQALSARLRVADIPMPDISRANIPAAFRRKAI